MSVGRCRFHEHLFGRIGLSELRSTVDALRSETVAELPDARVEGDFAELHRAVEQLEVETVRPLDPLSTTR
jgi:hypothetical protein